MSSINDYPIKPREVADKSVKGALSRAIKLALDVETSALRHNTQTFNRNKYRALSKLSDYEELKERARRIKEESIESLPELVDQLSSVISSRGGKVFLAKSAKEAREYVTEVCVSHGARLVVKAKSITSEEIGLNDELSNAGVEVAETDLAEFILQVSKEQPSHIVAPAIHRSRETISELFKRNFDTHEPLETGEELTRFARDILRKKFLSADVGITGANLVAAEEGTILLVESEGNIRLTTQLPAVHIAIVGIEKIIRSRKDFGIFIELLAASGTGQSLTSYTNVLEPPIELPVLNLNGRSDEKREFYLVLVDNGRMKLRDDLELKEALYCIRCSACMNSCANFQAVGGHAFGGECYTGGIGGAWTLATTNNLQKAQFAELCTGCTRCVPNCPVKIDIPRLNTVIKNRLIDTQGPNIDKYFFGYFSSLAKVAAIAPEITNWASRLPVTRFLMEKVVGVDKRRSIPPFSRGTLRERYNRYRKAHAMTTGLDKSGPNVVLFADVYTSYTNAEVGMATIRVFDKLGIPITLSRVYDDGRGLQSQGLIERAKKKARKLAPYLASLIDDGNDIIVSEPSVLAMFRRDYKELLNNDELFVKIKEHSYDPFEYLLSLVRMGIVDIRSRIHAKNLSSDKVFYHAHCQMKTIGAGNAAKDFFSNLGFSVTTSDVECCGMAGSFGYKKKFYDVSKRVGDDLVAQINEALFTDGGIVIMASGISCREQIRSDIANSVFHPIEVLEKVLD
jgi:iron-sulfur cluster protein